MGTSTPALAVVHHSYGPYHLARARALRRSYPGRVTFIQLANSESQRAWRVNGTDLAIETAVEGKLDSVPPPLVAKGLEAVLNRVRPDVLAIAGYADVGMRRAATWARSQSAKAVLMSDSQACDWPRRRWRELLKRRWVSRYFDAAFVSGATAAFYAESLGIPGHKIWRGYDVVDNHHFTSEAAVVRGDAERLRASSGLPRRFFLYVGRLAPEKNLGRLIAAFRAVIPDPRLKDWGLVLVGSGPLETELRNLAAPAGGRIRFEGFQQVDSLPRYYALADALVLPSISEPWGLVVNEAMASGLPIIVSRQCGCAMELVFPGVNGHIIDPLDPRSIEAALIALAANDDRRRAFSEASLRLIGNFSVETWSQALTGCSLDVGAGGGRVNG